MDHRGNNVDCGRKGNSQRALRPAENGFSHKPTDASRHSNRGIKAAEKWVGEGDARNMR